MKRQRGSLTAGGDAGRLPCLYSSNELEVEIKGRRTTCQFGMMKVNMTATMAVIMTVTVVARTTSVAAMSAKSLTAAPTVSLHDDTPKEPTPTAITSGITGAIMIVITVVSMTVNATTAWGTVT